jgi:hypothetical protein
MMGDDVMFLILKRDGWMDGWCMGVWGWGLKELVFTTDSDFRLYRRSGRQMIPLIIPD